MYLIVLLLLFLKFAVVFEVYFADDENALILGKDRILVFEVILKSEENHEPMEVGVDIEILQGYIENEELMIDGDYIAFVP